MRVLLVDDHTLFRKGLRALLEAKGNLLEVVGEATDGHEALQLIAEKDPDVVVMDIWMPGLNGLEATKQISERFPGVRVIILSTYGDKVYVKEAIKNGAWGFMLKDAVYEELVVAVNAVKNNKRYLTPEVLEPILSHYMESPLSNDDLKTHDTLTKREKEIFKLLSEKISRKEIGVRLGISTKTVDSHRFNILQKLKLNNETDNAKLAPNHKQTK